MEVGLLLRVEVKQEVRSLGWRGLGVLQNLLP